VPALAVAVADLVVAELGVVPASARVVAERPTPGPSPGRLVAAELVVVAVVVALVVVVAELVVVAVAAVVVVLEAAVPSSPRWRCWSPIAAVVAVPALVTELVVV
jgi:hypothetical protein